MRTRYEWHYHTGYGIAGAVMAALIILIAGKAARVPAVVVAVLLVAISGWLPSLADEDEFEPIHDVDRSEHPNYR